MKAKKMGGSPMPQERWEKPMSQLKTSDLKYCHGMNGGEDLEKASAGLANYVKSKKMKYD